MIHAVGRLEDAPRVSVDTIYVSDQCLSMISLQMTLPASSYDRRPADHREFDNP